jgi:hypothetical protein
MKKFLIICLFTGFCCINFAKAQSLIVSAKGGFAYASGSLDSEIGFMGTVSLENKFNKYFSLGINGKFGGVEYIKEKPFLENNIIVEERKLDIYNSTYAANGYSKISFIATDEIILSLVPEFGFYWTESRPVIYFTDKVNAEVTHKSYNTVWADRNISFGLHLEGQYYLSDRMNILASVGWNNYNIGESLNKVNLEGDWNYELDEKSFFLYFEIGITYLLFGKDIWE